jgi:hypothetical protein
MANEYRTQEQLENMAENCNNGNWSDAAQNAVDYGFYTNDIANMDPNAELWVDGWQDVAILVEMAQKLR